MKATAATIQRHVDTPDPAIRFYLFHGPDEAGAAALAAQLVRSVGDDVEKVAIDPAGLRSDPARLIDEATSPSLFGTTRVITISGVGEEGHDAFKLLIDAQQAAMSPVVAIAPNIKASGKTVKLAIASNAAVSYACYPPEGRNAVRAVTAMASEEGLRLTGDCAEQLWDMCAGDRSVVARELEKIALFLDAAADRPRDAGADALAAVAARRDESEMFETIALIVDGDASEAGLALRTLGDGPGAVPLLRQLARRLTTLAALRTEVDGGRSVDQVIERHRIFWKERDATARILRRWDSARLAHAVDRVRLAERTQMSSRSAGEIEARDLAVRLARSVSRLR